MSRTLLLALSVALVLCTALTGVFANVGSSHLPGWAKPYESYAWPAFFLALLITLALGACQAVVDTRSRSQRTAAGFDAEQLKRNRRQMIARIRHDWIDGVLTESLYQVARIDLGLQDRPDIVDRPLTLMVQEAARRPRLLPPRTRIGGVFDTHVAAGGLLILGAPGAGKTTLLLELACDLLDRAAADEACLIPVVFHLSSWAARQLPFAEWLVEELNQLYDVPRKLSQHWVSAGQILPLLDGLDEIAGGYRDRCVKRINEFRRQFFVPIAVCSRSEEYHRLSGRLQLPTAVIVQPLSRAEVKEYLDQHEEQLAGLHVAVEADPRLLELFDNPLLLSVGMLAYSEALERRVFKGASIEARRRNLFEGYVDAMLNRRTQQIRYSKEQTLRWLAWLASSMMRLRQSVFRLESLNQDWLRTPRQVILLNVGVALVVGLVLGVVVGPGIALSAAPVSGRTVGLLAGPELGLLMGLVTGVFGSAGGLKLAGANGVGRPVTALRWTAPSRSRLIVTTCCAVATGTAFARIGGGISAGLMAGLTTWLIAFLLHASEVAEVRVERVSNGGTWRSGLNSLPFMVVFGLASILIGWKSHGVAAEVAGLLILIGLMGPDRGAGFFVQHWCIRLLLARNGRVSYTYVRFLDYAVQRIFLRKVGGGYIFIHRMLMEYLASLAESQPSARSISAP